jgi:hypothetical protein
VRHFREPQVVFASPKIPFINDASVPFAMPDLYVQMFEEDVRLRIMPVGGRRYNEDFCVALDGDPEDFDRFDALFSLMRDYEWTNREENFTKGVERIASHLLLGGAAYFEIIQGRKDGNPKLYFALHGLQAQYIYSVPQVYLHFSNVRDLEGHLVKRFAKVKKSDIWRVDLPKALGSAADLRKLKNCLAHVQAAPNFQRRELEQGRWSGDYDAQEFGILRRLAVLRGTRAWGWNGRDSSLTYETEFYTIYRTARFHWAVSTLREHIMERINDLLRSLKINCQVAIKGVLSSSEVQEIQESLLNGYIDFAEAFRRLKLLP